MWQMRNCIVLALIFFILSCGETDIKTSEQTSLFSEDSLAKNISVLASDEFQGRKPFTAGETKTINYLKNNFLLWVLSPEMAIVISRKCQW